MTRFNPRNPRAGFLLSALTTLVAAFAGPAASDEITVDGARGDTIQDGVDQARDGDTVRVLRGDYSGPGNNAIRLNGKRLTLLGDYLDFAAAPRLRLSDATPTAFIFVEDAERDVRIINFEFDDGGPQLQIDHCTPTLESCTFLPATRVGSGTGGVALSNCEVVTKDSENPFQLDNSVYLHTVLMVSGGAFVLPAHASIEDVLLYPSGDVSIGANSSVHGLYVDSYMPIEFDVGEGTRLYGLYTSVYVTTDDMTLTLHSGCTNDFVRADGDFPRLRLLGDNISVSNISYGSFWSGSAPLIDVAGRSISFDHVAFGFILRADDGAAIRLSGSDIRFTNCGIYLDLYDEGAVGVDVVAGDVTLQNCRVAGGECDHGCQGRWAAVRAGASLQLHNTYSGRVTTQAARVEEDGTVDIDYSDLVNAGSAFDVADGGVVNWGDGNIDVRDCTDPCNMTAASPLRNAGDPTDLDNGGFDICGKSRLSGGRIDIGVAEFQELPVLRGDLNCNGAVDFGDLDAFVLALIGRYVYQPHYLPCNYMNGDINGDGSVDFNDIDGFVECLINGGCE